MKETRFIAQNKEKWREAEELLDSPVKDPEKLANLFVQVVDDLSYSRTYYPNRSVRVYLNKIARLYFSLIYSHKKEKHGQFKLFWQEELPQIILFCKKELIISFIVFAAAVSIGVFSSMNDPQFVNTILGDGYVKMTEQNIASGDPMAVYKQSHQLNMFLGITFNNLMVAFRTYVLGIFLCIGTLASLVSNGVMVGCFQYYFLEQGLFIESASSIWLHGTLEISSVILAGGAGLTLGRGLIFPGTYSRLQSLQISGMRSLKLMLGIAPIFVFAAIIESFLTRYTDAPAALKLLLIFLSAFFIIGYFIIYPWKKSQSGFKVALKETKLPPSNIEPTKFNIIKSNSDVLKDTFRFYSHHSSTIVPLVLSVAAMVSLASLFLDEEPAILFQNLWWSNLFSDMFFALHTPTWPFIIINSIGTTIVIYRIISLVDNEFKKSVSKVEIRLMVQLFLTSLILFSAIYFGVLGGLFVMAIFGLLLLLMFAQVTERINWPGAFGRSWELFGKNNNQGVGLQFMLLLLSFSFLLILSAPIHYIHMSALQWNFVSTDPVSQKIIRFLELFIKTSSFYLVMPLMAASFGYLYFSQMEVNSANALKESISQLSSSNFKTTK